MRTLCIVAAVLALTVPVFAGDSGDSIFPIDMKGKERAELVYENMQRDLDVDSGPAGARADLDADALFLRMHSGVGEYAYFDIDLGAINPSGGDWAFYFGMGLRYLVYDGDGWRASAFAQAHYASGVEAEEKGSNFDYDLLEADAGLLAIGEIPLGGGQVTLMPYVGPVMSVVRLDGDADSDLGISDEFDAQESTPVGVAMGVSLLLPGQNSIRLETRYFDQFGVSFAGTVAF